MSSNIQRLGDTLSNRMKKTANSAVPTTLELGNIRGNLSLTTDSLPAMIPKGQYMVNRALDVAPGDRVLVAWCGNEPVVIAVVGSS